MWLNLKHTGEINFPFYISISLENEIDIVQMM